MYEAWTNLRKEGKTVEDAKIEYIILSNELEKKE
jgi:acyl-CoA-binding protein